MFGNRVRSGIMFQLDPGPPEIRDAPGVGASHISSCARVRSVFIILTRKYNARAGRGLVNLYMYIFIYT